MSDVQETLEIRDSVHRAYTRTVPANTRLRDTQFLGRVSERTVISGQPSISSELPKSPQSVSHLDNRAVRFKDDPPIGKSSSRGHSSKRARTAPHARSADTASLEAWIEQFKARSDLRPCRVPGMLSGISPHACESRRRHILKSSSHLMAKIKLEPCSRCPYGQGIDEHTQTSASRKSTISSGTADRPEIHDTAA